jgi:hypothetical protein
MERGGENNELGTGFFVHKRILSAVKRVEFVSDRMSYIILRGCWFHINVLNVRFEVFTVVSMKNGVFWDVTPCGSCKNDVSEEPSASFIRMTRIGELGTLAVTSN